jgi:hypothetical protein
MIPVTADSIRSVYVLLQAFPPFCRWSLPPPEDLTFYVVDFKSEHAEYDPNKKTIRVSTENVSTFLSLLQAVGHEMIHVRQDVSGRYPVKNVHNADFKRYARQVCKHFPFLDPLNL